LHPKLRSTVSAVFWPFPQLPVGAADTYYFSAAEYGVVSEFYAYAGFFLFTIFGFETGYFRFRDKEHTGRMLLIQRR